jgi:hypothetical protein
VGQTDAFGIGEATVNESQFWTCDEVRIPWHIHADEAGIAIVEGVGKIIRTRIEGDIIRHARW